MTTLLAVTASALVASGQPTEPTQTAAGLRAQGLELGFNLDHPEALSKFREAIAADPHDPAAYRLVAATMWINALFQHGAVTAEDFLGQAGSTRFQPSQRPDIERAIHEAMRRADAYGTTRTRDASSRGDALYQVGAVQGLLASYTATIEGSLRRSLSPARHAYREHERVLDVDPSRKDAGLIVGMYRYAVTRLPAWSRLVARIAGFNGDRERGIRLVEEAASYSSDAQANALFSLVVIYNREARFDDALRVIAELQRRYPRNRLLWLEAGCTALRANRPLDARDALERGLAKLATDSRPRAFGELARWHYHYGVALARLKQRESADRALAAALLGDAHDWVRGRAHLERAKLASISGERHRANEEYRAADRLCEAAGDIGCVKEAKAFLRRR